MLDESIVIIVSTGGVLTQLFILAMYCNGSMIHDITLALVCALSIIALSMCASGVIHFFFNEPLYRHSLLHACEQIWYGLMLLLYALVAGLTCMRVLPGPLRRWYYAGSTFTRSSPPSLENSWDIETN